MVPSPFLVTAVPAAPLNVTVNHVERVSGGGNVTITVSWIRPLNYELFDIDHYDINVSSTSGEQQMTTTCGECTNTTVTDINRYDTNVSSGVQQMAITVNGGSNSTVITVVENPSNVRLSTTFTVTISARNRCGENSPIANASYTLSKFTLHVREGS